MKTRSFDGNDAHGTMLPSTAPLAHSGITGENPPARRSIGDHTVVPASSAHASHTFQEVRSKLPEILRYWREEV